LKESVENYCHENGLEVRFLVMENGIACDSKNPALKALIEAVRQNSGMDPRIGKKLAGTSARFAPGGQGVVWGMGLRAGLLRHSKRRQCMGLEILQRFF
jgi:hypothetical protein